VKHNVLDHRAELRPGVFALPGGLLWLQNARSLLVADAHLGYEEVIGGALPLWSTVSAMATLSEAASTLRAEEIVFLGDVIHGAAMSDGAAGAVSDALQSLRKRARVVLIAGNHEGRSRGLSILGETFERLERNGWSLLHGDRHAGGERAIIGHLHPSLHLSGGESVPVFLAERRLIVVPALTPYSRGLDVRSEDCIEALRAWNVVPQEVRVVASGAAGLFAFGALSALRAGMSPETRAPRTRFRRRFLEPDR
jgi:metallophosphoesterase superfamily enzyme